MRIDHQVNLITNKIEESVLSLLKREYKLAPSDSLIGFATYSNAIVYRVIGSFSGGPIANDLPIIYKIYRKNKFDAKEVATEFICLIFAIFNIYFQVDKQSIQRFLKLVLDLNPTEIESVYYNLSRSIEYLTNNDTRHIHLDFITSLLLNSKEELSFSDDGLGTRVDMMESYMIRMSLSDWATQTKKDSRAVYLISRIVTKEGMNTNTPFNS